MGDQGVKCMDAAGVIPRLTHKVETGEGFFEAPGFVEERIPRSGRHEERRPRAVPPGRTVDATLDGQAAEPRLQYAPRLGERGRRTWSG